MTFNRAIILHSSIAILSLFATPAWTDSTITIQAESGDAVLQVKRGRVLLKSNNNDDRATIQNINISEAIFDTHQETLYLIDHDQQSVSVITKANIEQFGNTVDAAVDILDSMPSEQRESIADLLGGFGVAVPEPETNKAMQLRPVAEQAFRGIQCQENQVIEAEQELGRVCITQANTTPLSNDDYQTLLNTQAFFLLMAKQAKPFAQQYGQTMPNLDGLELTGLIVYSNQTHNDTSSPNANFVVTNIDLDSISDITVPSEYQLEPLILN